MNNSLRLDHLAALDVHVHVEADTQGRTSLDQELLDASAAYFRGTQPRLPTLHDVAAYYRERNIGAVVFTVDAETALGQSAPPSEEIAEAAAAHADILIPFGSVDPLTGEAAVRRARRLVEQYGVRGFKFHPSVQAFQPNDRAFYPLYEALQEMGVPALFHTGQTGIGAGLPGGRRIKLRFSDPMLLDDVAADFPGLTLILAHASIPLARLGDRDRRPTRRKMSSIDSSGLVTPVLAALSGARREFPAAPQGAVRVAFPAITPDRWLADFAALDIKPDVRPLILKENAARVLGFAS